MLAKMLVLTQLLSRGTIITRLHEMYNTDSATKVRQLAETTFIVLTGDHMFIIQADPNILKLQLIVFNYSL